MSHEWYGYFTTFLKIIRCWNRTKKTDLVGVVSLTPLNNFMLVKLGSPPSSATWAAGTPGGRTAQSGDGTNEGWSEGSFGVAVFFGGEMETEGEVALAQSNNNLFVVPGPRLLNFDDSLA